MTEKMQLAALDFETVIQGFKVKQHNKKKNER